MDFCNTFHFLLRIKMIADCPSRKIKFNKKYSIFYQRPERKSTESNMIDPNY